MHSDFGALCTNFAHLPIFKFVLCHKGKLSRYTSWRRLGGGDIAPTHCTKKFMILSWQCPRADNGQLHPYTFFV
jgi:hypothetical protein